MARSIRASSRHHPIGRAWLPALAASTLLHGVVFYFSFGLAESWSGGHVPGRSAHFQPAWLAVTDLALEPIKPEQQRLESQDIEPPIAQPDTKPRSLSLDQVARKPEPSVIEISPGIDESDADTPSWIGAATSTEHSARPSSVDQPALSREPGVTGPESEARESREARDPIEPREAQRASDARRTIQSTTSEMRRSNADSSISPVKEPETDYENFDPSGLQPAIDHARSDLHNSAQAHGQATAMSEHATDTTGADDQDANKEAERPEIEPVLGVQPQEPSGTQEHRPGALADRESTPSSREETLTFRPGMPLAREGLTIRPVLPRFSTTTRVLSHATRNPLIIVTFNAKGKVTNAQYAPGRTTGSEEWDAPLLDSIYRWTASGRRLRDLTRDDPDAVLVLRVEYILNESARR